MQDISANVPRNRSHRGNSECCHAHHCDRFFFVSPLAGTVQEPQSATRGNERLRRSRTPSGLSEIVSDYSQYFTRWFIAHSNEGWNDFELQRRASQKGIPTSADPSEISDPRGGEQINLNVVFPDVAWYSAEHSRHTAGPAALATDQCFNAVTSAADPQIFSRSRSGSADKFMFTGQRKIFSKSLQFGLTAKAKTFHPRRDAVCTPIVNAASPADACLASV